ncbi:Dual 3prime [Diplonema papillatum]|nr:Dual 3prime [Diplonema papillatum]
MFSFPWVTKLPFMSWLNDPRDDVDTRNRKQGYVFFAVTSSLCASSGLIANLLQPEFPFLATVGVLYPLACMGLLGHTAWTKRVTTVNVSLLLVFAFATVLVADLEQAALKHWRLWPCFVLLAHVGVFCRLPVAVSAWLVGCSVVWITLMTAEDIIRFGAYPLHQRPSVCSCANPPCPVSPVMGVYSWGVSAFVLMINFAFTQYFTSTMNRERASLRRSIDAAKRVSQLLVEFRLSEAESVLSSDAVESVSEEFVLALQSLLENLTNYRRFLPQSCLPTLAEASVSDSSESSEVSSSNLTQCTSARARNTLPEPGAGTHLVRRAVTICMLNLNTFMKGLSFIRRSSDRGFTDKFQAYFTVALGTVQRTKGVVDHFMGDHISSSWNASHPCSSHCRQAVAATSAIHAALQQDDVVSHSGVSTSDALCGNMGTDVSMCFHIIGAAYPLSSTLTDVAKAWSVGVLADSNIIKSVKSFFEVQAHFEHVVYHKNKVYEPLVLWEVLRPIEDEGKEWMYVVQTDVIREGEIADALIVAYLLQTNDLRLQLDSARKQLPDQVTHRLASVVERIDGAKVRPQPVVVPPIIRRTDFDLSEGPPPKD